MFYKTSLFILIALWHQIQGDDPHNDFTVDIPSYDEYSEWEPLPKFVFENNSQEDRTEDKLNLNVVPEEKIENTKENKIENVFNILEEIKERLEVINEPLNAIKEHLNDRNEPLKVLKEPLEDIILAEEVKDTLEDVVLLEAINEPLDDDGKDILERDCLKDNELDKEVKFAGPVKAKGRVSVGSNFGFDSSYPITPYYPPFFYGPFYYPTYYFPYSPPSNSHDIYVDILKSYLRIPPKRGPYQSNREIEDLPDCDPEGSELASYWPTPGEPKAGIPFGGFVPANGRISIAAHF